MARQKTTPEEIKQALKKEIIRLGIQDNPSRTVYQKNMSVVLRLVLIILLRLQA